MKIRFLPPLDPPEGTKSTKRPSLILTCLLTVTFSLPTAGLALPDAKSENGDGGDFSVEKVLALPEAQRFLGGADLGEAHAEAPAEIAQFGRLVGIWEAQAEMRTREGTWVEVAPAVWIWKYTLGGFATQDLWIHHQDHLPPYLQTLGRSYLLTGLRIYDAAANGWRIAWAANSVPSGGSKGGEDSAGQGGGQDFGTFTATANGDDVVLLGSSKYGQQRITFSDITQNSFVWTSEYSQDGKAWTAVMRVRARRRQ